MASAVFFKVCVQYSQNRGAQKEKFWYYGATSSQDDLLIETQVC